MNQLNRLTIKELWNELLLFFNFEKGIPYTFISLIKNPLRTVHTYLNTDRRQFFNPLNYVLIAVGIYTLIMSVHPSFNAYMKDLQVKNAKNYAPIEEKLNLSIVKPFERAQNIYLSYQNLFYLIILPLLSLITFWFFSKKYFYAEHLAINAFTFGTSTWVSLVISAVTFYVKGSIMILVVIPLISFALISYLYKKIFETTWAVAVGTMIVVYIVMLMSSLIFQFGLTIYFML